MTETEPLSVTHPGLAMEAVGWDPSKISYWKRDLLLWQCSEGHQWQAKALERINGKTCTKCNLDFKNIRAILDGLRDFQVALPIPKKEKQPLSVTHPDLAQEAVGWDPSQVTSGSNKVLLWRCKNGHEWEAQVGNRSRGRGCRICSTKVYNERKMALTIEKKASTNVLTESLRTPVLRRKRKNRELPGRTLSSGIHEGHQDVACSVCTGRKVLAGFNDLESKYPEIAVEADGWDPRKVLYGSGVKKQWICTLGHKWEASPNLRTQGSNCPYCSHKFLLSGFNDLATTNPELIPEVDGWDPTKVIGAEGKKMAWVCQEGHKWKATINNRRRGRGCPSCAKTGFNPNERGYLYYLVHPKWEMFQIGITNHPVDRLESHQELGWEVLEIRGPMDGHLTQQWETAMLRMLKAKGADLSNASIAGKFDGYSEAWSKSTFEAKSIKELMRLVEDYETI